MRWDYLLLSILLMAGLFQLTRPAESDFVAFSDDMAWICPADSGVNSPEQIEQANCEQSYESDIDTHRTQIWVAGNVEVPEALIKSEQPVGLYLSARAASRVYLNGHLLGQNGEPGANRATEKKGDFDTVFYVPKSTVLPGANSVTFLLSGQHSVVRVQPSILMFEFRAYREAPFYGRNNYWISLLTFGGFLIGAIYFGVTARLATDSVPATTLSIGAALAACQLLVEISRGYWAYAYPLHDIRQLLVCTLSLGVGLALVSHTFISLQIPRLKYALALIVIVAATGLLLVPGYDGKASWLMFVPSVTAGIAALFSSAADKSTRLSYAIAFMAFASLIVLDPGKFLDTYYYLSLMAFMTVLFVYQARAYRVARREQQVSEAARLQLEAALANLQSEDATYLNISAAGNAEKIDCADVAVVSAAGDYAVVRLHGGREILQNESLKALTVLLPEYFITVHRSHIVNSRLLAGLKRHPSGVGELHLKDGHTVPVSRRIFPKIKKSLFTHQI